MWRITRTIYPADKIFYDIYENAKNRFWREVHRAEEKYGDGKVFYFENGVRWEQDNYSTNFIELRFIKCL